MLHPEKWRETIDVNSLRFNHIEIIEILGYPHAGNDVFHARILYRGTESTAFIKIERQTGADIMNEINILLKLPFVFCPKLLDYSLEEPRYIVTEEAAGERLSKILTDKPETDVKKYLSKQASVLSEFHNAKIACEPVKDRKFFHIPSLEYCDEYGLTDARIFLVENKPGNPELCFVHGDFHYANILWSESNISCVLDYELSGIGIREFDMAWSVFLRPGQKFLKTMDEVNAFIAGYKNPFSKASFYYYLTLIAVYFYPLGEDDYKVEVKRLIGEAIDLFYA